MANEFQLRRATHADYTDVMNIGDNIYDGRDYLPTLYFHYMHLKHSNCYVALLKKQIIAFTNLQVIENGSIILTMASRMDPKYQGKGMMTAFRNRAIEEIKANYPDLQYDTWIRVNHPNRHTHPSVIHARWNIFTYDMLQEDIQKFTSRCDADVHVEDIQLLSLENSLRILEDPTAVKQLFSDKYFSSDCCWSPSAITNSNLREAAMRCSVTASFTVDGACATIAFCSTLLVKTGIRTDVWIYGKQATVSLVLAHIYHWMRYLESVTNLHSMEVKPLFIFPPHVSKERVRNGLLDKLGYPVQSDCFDNDEAVYIVTDIC